MIDLKKVGKIVEVPCSDNFFRWWFEILKPIHHLTNRECDVASAFFEKRYELEKSISDPALLDKVIMQEGCKKEIREKANVTPAFFQVIMGKLKKTGIIQEGRLNKKYVPNIKGGENVVGLTFIFKWKNLTE